MDYAKKQWITLNDETKSIEQWERQLASQAAEIERLKAELEALRGVIKSRSAKAKDDSRRWSMGGHADNERIHLFLARELDMLLEQSGDTE